MSIQPAIPVQKLRVLDAVFGGRSLKVARQIAGYGNNTRQSYKWLFSGPVRMIVRARLAAGETLPKNAMLAYLSLQRSFTTEQRQELHAILAETERTIIEMFSV